MRLKLEGRFRLSYPDGRPDEIIEIEPRIVDMPKKDEDHADRHRDHK